MNTLPSSRTPKKRLSAMAIVGLCCVGVLVIVGLTGMILIWRIHQSAPQFMRAVTAQPELEIVKVDDPRGEVSLRDKKTGKTFTVPMDDLVKGKLTIKNADDKIWVSVSTETGNLPAWMPAYPGSKKQPRSTNIGTQEGRSGTVEFVTTDPLAKVMRFYEAKLFEADFATQVSRTGADGDETRVTGIKENGKYIIILTIHSEGGKTVVIASFLERNS